MMTIQRLHELFDAHPGKNTMGCGGSCHDCGKDVRVAAALTAEGFAISGGALYEPEPDRFHFFNTLLKQWFNGAAFSVRTGRFEAFRPAPPGTSPCCWN